MMYCTTPETYTNGIPFVFLFVLENEGVSECYTGSQHTELSRSTRNHRFKTCMHGCLFGTVILYCFAHRS